MATAYSNIVKFSKLYYSNSDAEIKQVFNLSWGNNPVKFAYLGSTLIYDYRGTGYFIGTSYTDQVNQIEIYDENWNNPATYMFCYAESYLSVITLENGKLKGVKNFDGVDISASNPVGNEVNLLSYHLINNVQQTAPSMHIPKLPPSYTYIQNHTYCNYDLTNSYASYAYIYKNNSTIIGDKIAFNFFIPRRAYTCKYEIVTTHYGSSNMYSGTTYNIYYNVRSELTFGTGIWSTTKPTGSNYKYEWVDSISYATSVTDAVFDSYINNVILKRNIINGNQNPKESAVYSFDSGLKKLMYHFSAVHSDHNGDTYYYYGKDKTLERYYGLNLNSYQHVNPYVTELKEPLIHDRIHMYAPKWKLQPYIITRINYTATATAADNWPDIRSMFLIHRISNGALYKLNYGEIGSSDLINYNGLNQDWAQLIYDNLSWISNSRYDYRNEHYLYDRVPYIGTSINYDENNNNIGRNYYLRTTAQTNYVYDNRPPVRDFPNEEMRLSLSTYPGNSYTSSSNIAWFNITSSPQNTETIDSSNFLTAIHWITQYTPDIDGQNHLKEDYVLYGCSYVTNLYDINGNITSTQSNSSTGNPYYYSSNSDVVKFPWEWHDEDFNIICISYNSNLTYGEVEYHTTYGVDFGFEDYDTPYSTTQYEIINTYLNGTKITAEVSYFRHNLTINHNYDRPLFDSHNHLNFCFNQTIKNSAN